MAHARGDALAGPRVDDESLTGRTPLRSRLPTESRDEEVACPGEDGVEVVHVRGGAVRLGSPIDLLPAYLGLFQSDPHHRVGASGDDVELAFRRPERVRVEHRRAAVFVQQAEVAA